MFHLGKRIVAEKTAHVTHPAALPDQTEKGSLATSASGSPPRRHLTSADFDRITTILMKPSSKAQYSKVLLQSYCFVAKLIRAWASQTFQHAASPCQTL